MSARRKRSRHQPVPARRGGAASRFTAMILLAAAVVAAVVYVSTTARPPEPASDTVASQQAAPAPVYGYDVVREYPHNPDAFTQGLIFRDGFLFESTGLAGRSSLRKVELETGRVLQRRDIDSRYFAEGLTDWRNQLVQLTYTTNVGFVYDLATFAQQSTFKYEGQGWGLTRDDRRLIMSDGSSTLRFLDPATFKELGRLPVRDNGRPIEKLNELELVKGEIYANVWFEDRIAIIRPDSGQVTGWIDLSGLGARLVPPPRDDTGAGAVLNGIAYDAARDRLLVTGKLWPKLFEIRVRQGAAR